jgi:hypothetical protein
MGVSSFTLQMLYPWEIKPLVSIGGWVGTRNDLEMAVKRKIPASATTEPQTSSP